jgi:hypothetical protein
VSRLPLTTAAQAAAPARDAHDAHDAALTDLLGLPAGRQAGPVALRRAARALGSGPRSLAPRCPGVVNR